jgi:gliding motility-associated-like protein
LNVPVFILFLVFLLANTLSAQHNLVPNPSFEDTVFCPIGTAQPQAVAVWFNPTGASPDYYNACYGVLPPGSFGAGVPANDWGYQYAQDGVAYVGLATIAFDGNLVGYREYMAVKLTEKLIAGDSYYWCMYISLLDSVEYASNNIGVALSNNMITNPLSETILNIPVYGNHTDIVTDFTNWTKIGGVFEARGGEEYLYIGNFFTDNQTSFVKIQDNDRGGAAAYYYIDDVYLGKNPCIEHHITIPNVFTPNGDGINDFFKTEDEGLLEKQLFIYNRWGNLVFEGKGQEAWDGTHKGEKCHEGVYYVVVSYFNVITNQKEKKTGVVHLMR